ncbi:hypothetical protein IC582_000115 [Cucumis melo]|uniref:Uncharacterized protein n=1 Tax=Cucumis melo TaxID=3656 RepID=A0A9I9DHT3_CUCME
MRTQLLLLGLFFCFLLLSASFMDTAMADSDRCTRPCRKRCSKAKLKRRCMKYCRICCSKCKCVPGSYGKHHCPCYSHVHTIRGRAKCP